MKSNEIEPAERKFGPVAIRALAVGAINRRDRCRRPCSQRSRTRVHRYRPNCHWPCKNQAIGNWRAKSDPITRDRLNDHPAAAMTEIIVSAFSPESRSPRGSNTGLDAGAF